MGCEDGIIIINRIRFGKKILQSVAKCGFLSTYGKLGPALTGGIFIREPRIRRFKKVITSNTIYILVLKFHPFINLFFSFIKEPCNI